MRTMLSAFAAALLMAACATEDSGDSRPTLTVTGFRVFTNNFSNVSPSETIRIPAGNDNYFQISGVARDQQALRSIRFRIEPEFNPPNNVGDSIIWRFDNRLPLIGTDTTLTNVRVTGLGSNANKYILSNSPNGGFYRLRVNVIDAEGNVSEESIHRIELYRN